MTKPGRLNCPKCVKWAMRLGPNLEGSNQMAAVIQLPQTSNGQSPTMVRQPNQASRSREYLTPDEVERMITAARCAGRRLAERDALLNMMAYRRFRASEIIAL